MIPENGLEMALLSAGFDSNGVTVNPSVEENQKISRYMGLLDQIEFPERLMELQLKLESDIPYFEISSDGSIREYFSNFGVLIENKRDLRLFSYALASKISALDRKDKRVGPALKKLDYRRNLQNLPKSLSKLETIVSDFGSLAGPFSSVLQYVLEQTGKGFRMVEDGKDATNPYTGVLTIKPAEGNSALISINLQESEAEVRDILKFYVRKLPESEKLEIFPLNFLGGGCNQNIKYQSVDLGFFKNYADFPHSVESYLTGERYSERLELVKLDEEEMIKQLVTETLEFPDKYVKSFQNYFRVLFNLPSIMHNYIERTESSLRDILSSTL